MNFFRNLGNTFLKIIWRLMITAVVCILVLNFSALIFISIRNTTGYCNSLMDKVISISIKSGKQTKETALWGYDN